MIGFDVDAKERTVGFEVPKSLYSKQGLLIAAQIFSSRAEVFLDESKTAFELTLKAKKKALPAPELEALGGEFLNELLNQEYRFIVGRHNQKISNLIITQTLFAARGGEKPPTAPEGENSPEFQREVEKLMKDAEDEVKRTMPKKIAPQGNPLPPAAEDAVV
jgi:His-Xaa-Ser system protein HxsD